MLVGAFYPLAQAATTRKGVRAYCLSAGAQFDRRVNKQSEVAGTVITGLTGVRQYNTALVAAGLDDEFATLTAG